MDVLDKDIESMHRDMIVVDTHVDTVLRYVDLGHDLTGGSGDQGYMDFRKMRQGNFTAAFYACCVEPEHVKEGTARERLEQLIGGVREFVHHHPDHLGMAVSGRDVRELAAEGRFAVIPAIEGAQAVDADLGSLEKFRRMGVRYMSPTHFNTNAWADSSTDEEVHGGLSELGREAIREMNRLGIIIDVSHVSDKTFWQILELSEHPVIASHSSARALVNHPRNLDDEMIRALADKGGVIGVTPWPEYISPEFCDSLEECADRVREKWREEGRHVSGGGDTSSATATLLADVADSDEAKYNILVTAGVKFPTLERFLDHVDHVTGIAGAEHVCFGTDHGAVRFEIEGWEDCTQLPNVTRRLLDRGYSSDEVRGIMGGNIVALLDRVPAGE